MLARQKNRLPQQSFRNPNTYRHAPPKYKLVILHLPRTSSTVPAPSLQGRLVLGQLVLLPHIPSLCPPPDISPPTHSSLNSSGWGECGTNIEVEHGFTSRLGLSGVVIDDIADLLLLAVDVAGHIPVVSIERWLGSAFAKVSITVLSIK